MGFYLAVYPRVRCGYLGGRVYVLLVVVVVVVVRVIGLRLGVLID